MDNSAQRGILCIIMVCVLHGVGERMVAKEVSNIKTGNSMLRFIHDIAEFSVLYPMKYGHQWEDQSNNEH